MQRLDKVLHDMLGILVYRYTKKNWSNSSEIIHPHRDGVDEIGPVARLSSCTVVRVSYHDFADVQQSLDGRLFTDVDFLLSSQNTQQQTENCAHLLTEQQSFDYCTYKTKQRYRSSDSMSATYAAGP